ncbi:MAG: hypothetical protein JKY08_06215, partial [Flavobacteriaceae bacterium]|nr:hypothetical protein [Flavobacteriaceae bacterium]
LGGVYESPAAFVAKYQGKCTYVNYRQGHWSKTFMADEYSAYVLEPTYSDASCTKRYDSGGYVDRSKNWASTTFNCPDGQELNPATNACEEPKPPFCESDDYLTELQVAQDNCFADNGDFTSSCNDTAEPPEWSFSCDIPPPDNCYEGDISYPECCDSSNNFCDRPDPSKCTIFSPNWPQCANDDGGFPWVPPSNPDVANPTLPPHDPTAPIDNDEPPVEDSTDGNELIKSLNADMNKQLTSLNNDLNTNHSETLAIGKTIVDGIELNIKATVDTGNLIKNSIEDQTKSLHSDIDKGNDLLHSLNNVNKDGFSNLIRENKKGFGDVVAAIDGLGNISVVSNGGLPPQTLYTDAQLIELTNEVDVLQAEYETELANFKDLMLPTGSFNSGEFNPHNLEINWHGVSINTNNAVLKALQDNAYIISSVVMLMFGMMGFRAILGGS